MALKFFEAIRKQPFILQIHTLGKNFKFFAQIGKIFRFLAVIDRF
jgi:hypothetical protein